MKIEQKAASGSVSSSDIYTPIKALKVGKYDQIFLIQKITHNDSMVTANGSPFARVIVRDLTGEIEGVIWNYVPLDSGRFYKINLEVKKHKGQLEFVTDSSSLAATEEPLNVHDYIKGISDTTLTSYAGEIEEVLEIMLDEHYRNIVGNAIQRLDLIYDLKTSAYGLSGPLAYKGGLLVHVAGSLRLAKMIVNQAKEYGMSLNASLVFASCILRNIGWHTSTTFAGSYLRPKDAFYMIGINKSSARYVNHLMIHVESDLDMKIPEAKKQALENACDEVANIKTVEGRIAASADSMMNLLHLSDEELQGKTRGNWTNDLFTGHNS